VQSTHTKHPNAHNSTTTRQQLPPPPPLLPLLARQRVASQDVCQPESQVSPCCPPCCCCPAALIQQALPRLDLGHQPHAVHGGQLHTAPRVDGGQDGQAQQGGHGLLLEGCGTTQAQLQGHQLWGEGGDRRRGREGECGWIGDGAERGTND